MALMVSDRSHTVYSNLVLSYVVLTLTPLSTSHFRVAQPQLQYSSASIVPHMRHTLPLVGLNYAR